MPSNDYEWYVKADLSNYKGKYVVIIDKKVVASGDNAKMVLDFVDAKYPNKRRLLAKVPRDEILILVMG